ncbi:MAG: T9SS type A sorting domain-containing protein [Saprospiraceae bacterium]
MAPLQQEQKPSFQVVNLDRTEVVNLDRTGVVNLDRSRVVSLNRTGVVNYTGFSTIAQMCYAYGGRSVFDAQNLCISLLGEYFSQDNCNNGYSNENLQSRSNSVFEVNVNPNPVSDELFVNIYGHSKSGNNTILELTNNLGESTIPESEKINENELKLKLSKLTNGVYYLSVTRGENKKVVKIIVNH